MESMSAVHVHDSLAYTNRVLDLLELPRVTREEFDQIAAQAAQLTEDAIEGRR